MIQYKDMYCLVSSHLIRPVVEAHAFIRVKPIYNIYNKFTKHKSLHTREDIKNI